MATPNLSGNVQMCMSQNDSIDVVWSISPDTFGITSSLQETSITTAIEGRVWALEESPEPCLFEAKVAGLLSRAHVLRRFLPCSEVETRALNLYHVFIVVIV